MTTLSLIKTKNKKQNPTTYAENNNCVYRQMVACTYGWSDADCKYQLGLCPRGTAAAAVAL